MKLELSLDNEFVSLQNINNTDYISVTISNATQIGTHLFDIIYKDEEDLEVSYNTNFTIVFLPE